MLAKSYARRFEDRYRKIRQEFDVGEDDVPDEEGGNNSSSNNTNNNKTTLSGTKTPKGSSSSASNLSDTKSSPVPAKPTLDARAQFGSNLFLLSGMELGHVISTCEEECPECLENVPGGNDCHIEVNVDLIPSKVFDVLNTYVLGKVGGGSGSGGKSTTNGNSSNSRSGSPSTNSEKKGPGRPKKKQKKEKD